jgi:hypothetical protein
LDALLLAARRVGLDGPAVTVADHSEPLDGAVARK